MLEREGALPFQPASLPVMIGTHLRDEEVDFLVQNGIILEGFGGPNNANEAFVPGTPFPGASVIDLRINVNTFQEKVVLDAELFRFSTRNGRRVRSRACLSAEHLKRIKSSEEETKRVITEKSVDGGNGWGKQVLIGCHELDGRIPRRYWVQICCFPSCSCDDFFKGHTHNVAYVPCKHIYWVFRIRCSWRIRLETHLSHPVLTVGEVRQLLSGWQ